MGPDALGIQKHKVVASHRKAACKCLEKDYSNRKVRRTMTTTVTIKSNNIKPSPNKNNVFDMGTNFTVMLHT